MASAVSSVKKLTVWHRASSSTACCMVTDMALLSSVLVIDKAKGGPAARRCAQPSTNASSSRSATTRLRMPSSLASSADRMSAKYASSFARCRPISRGSSHDDPPSTDRPRREKISEKRALSDATVRSHARARPMPAPAAMPRILAMVGWGMRCSARITCPKNCIRTRCGSWGLPLTPAGSAMSAPEQNAPPAPVRTSTRSSRRRATSVKVSDSSRHMRPLPAFLRSGRFSVTVTTPASRSTMIVSVLTVDTLSTGARSRDGAARRRRSPARWQAAPKWGPDRSATIEPCRASALRYRARGAARRSRPGT